MPSKVACLSGQSIGIWLIRHASGPTVVQSIPVANLDLVQVDAFLRLIETGTVHYEEFMLLTRVFVGTLLKNVDSADVAEVSMSLRLVLRKVARNVGLGRGFEQVEVVWRSWTERAGAELVTRSTSVGA